MKVGSDGRSDRIVKAFYSFSVELITITGHFHVNPKSTLLIVQIPFGYEEIFQMEIWHFANKRKSFPSYETSARLQTRKTFRGNLPKIQI